MKLLRQGSIIKVVKPKDVEDFIKDLLASPEEWGKKMFVTKLIFSASGVDGEKLRDNVLSWLTIECLKDTDKPIEKVSKPSWKKSKGSDGTSAK